VPKSRSQSECSLEVRGFTAAGVHCGIKRRGLDLALIHSEIPAVAAGVFTRSTVVGAPVELTRDHLRRARPRAIVANSGCANVALGARGARIADRMARATAHGLGCRADEVLVASTGVIGEPLPVAKVRAAMARAVRALRPQGFPAAARAIMTTDTVPKFAGRELRLGGRDVRVAGIAKGSGMIEPDMATLLSFVVTDAEITAPLARRILRRAVDASFNRVTVDGEGSTSDTVLLLANGAAGNLRVAELSSRDAQRLARAVEEVCGELARAIARDGEGATKAVTVAVAGAATRSQAERAARRIANSLLVKTALFGEDPNWGRILQTVGAGRIAIDLDRAEIRLAGVPVFRHGRAAGPEARRAARRGLRARDVEIRVALGVGTFAAELWTCDLSYDYVRINAEYHT